jgi:hypothetical protein
MRDQPCAAAADPDDDQADSDVVTYRIGGPELAVIDGEHVFDERQHEPRGHRGRDAAQADEHPLGSGVVGQLGQLVLVLDEDVREQPEHHGCGDHQVRRIPGDELREVLRAADDRPDERDDAVEGKDDPRTSGRPRKP